MGHTFELVDVASRPTSTLRQAFLSVAVLRRLTELAAEIERGYRERYPELEVKNGDADRAREALQAFADAESIHCWLAEESWPAGQDTDFIRRSRSRARRRLHRALHRVRANPTGAILPTRHPASTVSPAPPPCEGAPNNSSGRSAAAVLVPLWTYRPSDRWLELHVVLARLSQRRLLTREVFKTHGAEVGDRVNGQPAFSPILEPYMWSDCMARPVKVDLARSLLPVWAGLMGTLRLDGDIVEWVLAETDMPNFTRRLSVEWKKAFVDGASTVPWAALTLWTLNGPWSRLTRVLQR